MGSTGVVAMSETKAKKTGKAKMWSEAKRVRIRIRARGLQDLQRPNQSCPVLGGLPQVYHRACCMANQQPAILRVSHSREKLGHRQAMSLALWVRHPPLQREPVQPAALVGFGRPRQMLTPQLKKLPSPTSWTARPRSLRQNRRGSIRHGSEPVVVLQKDQGPRGRLGSRVRTRWPSNRLKMA